MALQTSGKERIKLALSGYARINSAKDVPDHLIEICLDYFWLIEIIFNPSLGLKDVICSHYPVIFGRSGTKFAERLASKRIGFIGLGNDMKISRKYAKLQWNKNNACFELIVLHKNGIWSHAKKYEKNSILSLPMTKPPPLQMGTIKLYFMPANYLISKSYHSCKDSDKSDFDLYREQINLNPPIRTKHMK